MLIAIHPWQRSLSALLPERVNGAVLEVNALGTINGTLAAVDAMREHGGHVVNVVSLAGLTAVPGEAVYAASKHAALGFSLSTLTDLRLAGIRNIDISCVCPDGIWTPMLHDKLDDDSATQSFSGKLLQPEEVVTAVDRVLDQPSPVVTLPRWRGLHARLADALPGLAVASHRSSWPRDDARNDGWPAPARPVDRRRMHGHSADARPR